MELAKLYYWGNITKPELNVTNQKQNQMQEEYKKIIFPIEAITRKAELINSKHFMLDEETMPEPNDSIEQYISRAEYWMYTFS